MARGVKKIKWGGTSGKLEDFSKEGWITCIAPNQTASFVVSEWYDETTEEEKKGAITWLWMDQKKSKIFNKTVKQAGVSFGVELPKKLCGSYAYYLEASLFGKHDTRKTGLHVYGKCKEIITQGKWSKKENEIDTTEISYGNNVYVTLETEGLNGDKLTLDLYSKKDDTKIIQSIEGKCINGILKAMFTTLPCRSAVGTPEDLEEFYVKVSSLPNEYLPNASGEIKVITFKLKNKMVAPDIEKPTNTTPSKIGKGDKNPKEEEKKEESTTCACKDYDLIWGNKVSCDFRKKVVEIAKNLGLPQEKNEGANWLMAVMALETGRTFSPTCGTFKKHKDDLKIGYVGLIQFGKDAVSDLNVKRSELIKLTNTKQLKYVELFFKQKGFSGELKTMTDLYLAVNYPNACGHGTEKDYVVYDSNKSAYDDNPMFKRESDEYWIDKKGVKQYYKGKKGSSFVWEFEEAIKEFYDEGKKHKSPVYSCQVSGNPPVKIEDIVTYQIYESGFIEKNIPEKVKEDYKSKYQYLYVDSKYKIHDLGVFDFITAKKMNAGNVAGKDQIEILDARQFKGYNKDGVRLKFGTWNSDSERWYINPNCFAGLLGAMAKNNIEYLGFNGFSDNLGRSVGGSSSHRNGKKGDLRYLSTNKNGEATLLEDSHFDFQNQNEFNDSLYLFGWGRDEKMYSEYFKHGKDKKTLINHTKDMKKLGVGGYRHYHHLHLTGFDDSLILINSK